MANNSIQPDIAQKANLSAPGLSTSWLPNASGRCLTTGMILLPVSAEFCEHYLDVVHAGVAKLLMLILLKGAAYFWRHIYNRYFVLKSYLLVYRNIVTCRTIQYIQNKAPKI